MSQDVQMLLAEMSAWFKPQPWEPRPLLLAKLKAYLEGYARNGREIFAKRKYIAEKLKISVRTLARYLKHLREAGWLATVERKARYCIRRVLAAVPSFVPSLGRSPFSEGKPGRKKARPLKKRSTEPETNWYTFERLWRSGLSEEEALRRATFIPGEDEAGA